MDEQIKVEGGSLFEEILFAIKRYFVLIIAVVLLCSALGLGYSFIKEPKFTAYEEVNYIASAENGANTATDVNIMDAFFPTILDFCDEGVVVDRANFYCHHFYNYIYNSGKEMTIEAVDEFLEDVDVEFPYNIETTKIPLETYIYKNAVGVSVDVEAKEQNEYAFTISYTDKIESEAIIKARIYVAAFKRELKANCDLSDSNNINQSGSIYFSGIRNEINLLGSVGCVSDVSKTKFTLIGFAVGVVIAAVLVYVISVTDSSVKSREELERLTGANLFANVEFIGGKK